MFYVLLNMRKTHAHSLSRMHHAVIYGWLSRVHAGRKRVHAGRQRIHAGSQRVHAGSQRVLPLLSDLFVPVWSRTFSMHCIECSMRLSSVGSLPLAKNALHSPTSTIPSTCVDLQEAVEVYKKQNQFFSAELLEMNQLRSDDLTVNRQLTQLVLYMVT